MTDHTMISPGRMWDCMACTPVLDLNKLTALASMTEYLAKACMGVLRD